MQLLQGNYRASQTSSVLDSVHDVILWEMLIKGQSIPGLGWKKIYVVCLPVGLLLWEGSKGVV